MPNSDEIRRVIADALEPLELDWIGEGTNIVAESIIEDLRAAGYEITKKRCQHTGYRGPVRDGRKCPDCGGRVVELGAKI